MSRHHLRILMLGLVAACSRSGGKSAAPDAESTPPSTAAPATKMATGKASGPKASGSKASAPSGTAVAGIDAGMAPRRLIDDDDLKVEEADTNPFSETVTLKLSVTPQVKATVHWGAKVMARLDPGKMEAEIARPRGSGPLDLEIKAEGYMPYHTRLYTGRNDKLGIRLYRAEEASSVFGYKRSAEAKKAEAEKQEKQK
jgi:hypothetical protein